MDRHPAVSWVRWSRLPRGASVYCEVCYQGGPVASLHEVDAFAAAHREHRTTQGVTHYALGDAVAAVTKAVGIKACTPCEQRRMALNALIPRRFR